MSTLASQMLTAYAAHCGEADGLLELYQIAPFSKDVDDFQFRVQQNFYEGVHEAYQSDFLTELSKTHPRQQEIAELLGLRDRSSISQMKRSKSMDGVRMSAALYHHPEMPLPSQDRAALFGFARATSYIKAVAQRNPELIGSLTPQDYLYLIGLLASDQWDSAIQDPDPDKARKLAEQIISERTLTFAGPIRKGGVRPEQLVFKLQNVWSSWADFGILSLWAIPELIPEGREA
jgi:hypothetical protein